MEKSWDFTKLDTMQIMSRNVPYQSKNGFDVESLVEKSKIKNANIDSEFIVPISNEFGTSKIKLEKLGKS